MTNKFSSPYDLWIFKSSFYKYLLIFLMLTLMPLSFCHFMDEREIAREIEPSLVLAKNAASKGDYAQAIIEYHKVLAVYDKHLSPGAPRVLQLKSDLASLYMESGNRQAALDTLIDALIRLKFINLSHHKREVQHIAQMAIALMKNNPDLSVDRDKALRVQELVEALKKDKLD